jgi:ribosomal protein S18 acetylase RimI-like enzyme
LGTVEPYFILRLDFPATLPSDAAVRRVTVEDVEGCRFGEIREQAWYCGDDAASFGWLVDGEIAGLCVYWWGDRYRTRNFWPLAPRQAKLVEVITARAFRGKGIGRRLIQASAAHMQASGFVRLYARVWHSNTPSLAAFRAAGWRRVALVVQCSPGWRRHPLRLTLGSGPDAARDA